MIARSGSGSTGWQLILADLALILFLVTLSALASEEAQPHLAAGSTPHGPEVAPSQALFRPDPFGPTLAEWLARLPRDDRATLTVFAQHTGADRKAIWDQAQALAASAAEEGYPVRVVITKGAQSDLHASLAYDAPVNANEEARQATRPSS